MSDSAAGVGCQLAFLLEADKLKSVLPQTLIDNPHQENSAEHAWHLMLATTVLGGQAKEPFDPLRRAARRQNIGVRAS